MSLEVAPIERWMAARKARASKVKRSLFSPITQEDRVKAAIHMASMKASAEKNAVRTYNFDFAADQPLKGDRFEWEIADCAPMPYNSRLCPGGGREVAVTTCTLNRPTPRRVPLHCDTSVDTPSTTDTSPTAAPAHDSGVFTDSFNSDLESNTSITANTTVSPSSIPRSPATTSSPRLTASTLTRRRTIPDYFRQRKPRILSRVKRLQ